MKHARSFLTSFAIMALASGQAYAVTGHPVDIFHREASHISVTTVSYGDAAVLEEAKGFVHSFAQEGISFLGNPDLTDADRSKKFRSLLQRNFDMRTIGQFALGRYWKAATSAQQKEYLKLFEEMIIQVYSKRFGDYEGQDLEVVKARPEGKYDTLVTSMIVPDAGEKIQVDWRVRKKNGKFKVIDVVVEGVSMALTQRSDFSSVIQRGGGDLDVLLAHLREQ